MHNISYKERAKERAPKGSFFGVSIAIGVLSLLALLGSIAMLFIYPLVIDTSLPSVIDYFKGFFPIQGFASIVLPLVQVLVILGSIIFAVCKIVKMLRPSAKRGGNIAVGFSAGLGILFYCIAHELITLIGKPENLGSQIFLYGFVGFFGLSIIYDFINVCTNRSLWEKSDKKFNGLAIFTIIVCILAIAGGICYFDFSAKKFGTIQNFYINTLKQPDIATTIAGLYSVLAQGSLGVWEIIVTVAMSITTIAIIILAAKLVVTFLFNFTKLGADLNYVRGSKHFSRTSAIRTAGRFAFAWFFIQIINVVAQLTIAKVTFGEALKSIDIYYSVVFALILILSIGCFAVAKMDDSCAKDEEYSYSDGDEEEIVEEEQDEEVVDLTGEEVIEEPVEEPVVEEIIEEPVEEVVEEVMEEQVEVIEEPIVEEVVKEPEPVKETVEEPKKETAPQYPPYPYAPYPYPPYPYVPQGYAPYPAMPYPVYPQVMPYQVQQPASPTVICIPIQQPMPQMPMQQVPVQPVQMQQPVVPYVAPIAPANPATAEPAPVAEEEVLVTEDEPEEENKPFFIERKTLEEKFNELTPAFKKYYRDIMRYAEAKDGVKRNKSTYNDSVTFGRDCIVKTAIKQGKVVCSFSLINHEVKTMLKNGKSAREQLTVVKVVDATSFALAKQSVDMAYKLALDAKEARHQEQLRKRREARASKAANK